MLHIADLMAKLEVSKSWGPSRILEKLWQNYQNELDRSI